MVRRLFVIFEVTSCRAHRDIGQEFTGTDAHQLSNESDWFLQRHNTSTPFISWKAPPSHGSIISVWYETDIPTAPRSHCLRDQSTRRSRFRIQRLVARLSRYSKHVPERRYRPVQREHAHLRENHVTCLAIGNNHSYQIFCLLEYPKSTCEQRQR